MEAAQTLSIMMDIFSDFSGLRLNRAKSTFVGFGLSEEEMRSCSQILATPIGVLPIRYLGVPLVDRRLRIQDWQPVFEKVETRLGGWRACLLSRGGRLILLKAVLSAIPIYYMSIFTMPVGVRRRLEKIMRSFLWRGPQPDEARGTALVAWSTVCRHINQGGLGIRHLQHTNMALLTKWVCRMMQPLGDLVTVVLRDEYGSSLDWEMWRTPRCGDSAFMSSVRTCFPQVQSFFKPQLGNGETFRFGCDNWSGHGRLDRLFPRLYTLSTDKGVLVQQAWNNAWVPPLPVVLRDQRAAELNRLQELLTDCCISEAVQDAWIWNGPSFTTQAAYRRLRDQENPEDPLILQRCRVVWKRRLPLKIKVFAWLLLRRRLMTRSRLQRMVPDALAECPLCAGAVEDCPHLFFVCPLAQTVWEATGVGHLVVNSEEAFWRSLGGGTFRRGDEWQTIFATL